MRRNLLSISGISQVVALGGEIRQLQITVRPTALAQYNVALTDVIDAVTRASRSPAAGFQVEGGQEYLVRGLGRAREPQDVAAVVVRVAGYTDERGGLNRNNPLAQSRADTVVDALVALGVARERLVAVGRANGVNLSNTTGPASANRRVQFEIGFAGEAQ